MIKNHRLGDLDNSYLFLTVLEELGSPKSRYLVPNKGPANGCHPFMPSQQEVVVKMECISTLVFLPLLKNTNSIRSSHPHEHI
jgi:hypothetical protein